MINIRTIQHYMYCPRRFGLLEINNDWSENAFVALANIMHERVHSGKHKVQSSKKIELSSVAVYNDELELYGITDCIEFTKCSSGVYIPALGEKCTVKIIEYKPKQPKTGEIRETDAIQVFAQKVCADSIWKCNCEAYIYYEDTRKRVKMPFDTEYDRYYKMLNELINKIRACIDSGIIPPKQKGQKCSGCSIKDICMPKSTVYNIREEILKDTAVR